jgi:hypothetical protein
MAPCTMTRRMFARSVAAAILAAVAGESGCDKPHKPASSSRATRHPNPRVGIDGSRVLSSYKLSGFPKAVPVFDMVRENPEVMDSIHCYCSCASTKRFRSLLVCFEGDGMARDCDLCLEQASRVYGLHRTGMSIDRIRTIMDAAFG